MKNKNIIVLLILNIFVTSSCYNQNEKTLNKEELKKTLTPMQYAVTQENETEPPFNNEYWNNKKEGIYVDIISGENLFR